MLRVNWLRNDDETVKFLLILRRTVLHAEDLEAPELQERGCLWSEALREILLNFSRPLVMRVWPA
jgi:hypothetical protein